MLQVKRFIKNALILAMLVSPCFVDGVLDSQPKATNSQNP